MQKKGLVQVNLAVLLFGMAGVLAKWIHIPAVGITFFRVLFSSASLFLLCALRRTFLTGESPQSTLVVGRIQPMTRVSIARWNLKEVGGKSLV